MSRIRVRGAGERSQSCFAAHAHNLSSIQHIHIPCPGSRGVSLSLLSCPVQSTRPLERPSALINPACTGAAWEQFPAALWFVLETCKREFGGWLRHSFFPLGFPAVPAPQPSRSSGCLGCKFSKISWRKFFRMSFKKNQSETWMFSQSCADFGKGVVHFRRKTNKLWCYSDSVNEKSKE